MKESTEDPMVLLCKFVNISFGIFKQIRVHGLILKTLILIGFKLRYLMVFGTVRLLFLGTFGLATTKK